MIIVGILLVALAIGGGAWFLSSRSSHKRREEREAQQLADAQADARRWIERLGGQVMQISGTDSASRQAMADASERFTAANAAISRATTAKQANLARESALEGMHYVNAAREIMGMNPGPELPPLEGQRAAGKVTEERTVEAAKRLRPHHMLLRILPTTTRVESWQGVRFRQVGTPVHGGPMRCTPACGWWATP